ncbi:MAG: regulatory protein RecX [Blastocatellia bacterium]
MQEQRADSDGSGKLGDRNEEKVTAAALRMLAARPRTETQLRERLMSLPWTNQRLVDDCISRLKEMDYVNDDKFAESYASHRLSVRPVGRARLARELALKKVDRQTIECALDRVFDDSGEDELIDRAIQKRIRTHGRPAERAESKRMFDHLARLGFEFDLITRKLDALRRDMLKGE